MGHEETLRAVTGFWSSTGQRKLGLPKKKKKNGKRNQPSGKLGYLEIKPRESLSIHAKTKTTKKSRISCSLHLSPFSVIVLTCNSKQTMQTPVHCSGFSVSWKPLSVNCDWQFVATDICPEVSISWKLLSMNWDRHLNCTDTGRNATFTHKTLPQENQEPVLPVA